MIPIALVTLDHAKADRREVSECQDSLIYSKLRQCTEIAMHYKKLDEIPEDWLVDAAPAGYDIGVEYLPVLPAIYNLTDSPPVDKYVMVPGGMQAGILVMLGLSFENRESGDLLTDGVVNLLGPEPTLA